MKSNAPSQSFVRIFILIRQLLLYAYYYFILGCVLCFHQRNFVASAPQNVTRLSILLCALSTKLSRACQNKPLLTRTCTYCDTANGSLNEIRGCDRLADTWITGAINGVTSHLRSIDTISADCGYILKSLMQLLCARLATGSWHVSVLGMQK